jgi:hypothetical protein
LDRPELVEPMLEMFTKSRLKVGETTRPPTIFQHARLMRRLQITSDGKTSAFLGASNERTVQMIAEVSHRRFHLQTNRPAYLVVREDLLTG